MQIVIDISEDDLRKVQDGRASVSMMRKAIRNGTPLPKGHGRIVDISEIEYLKVLHDAKYGKIPWSEAIKQIKNSAPTLVEADKAESEDKE